MNRLHHTLSAVVLLTLTGAARAVPTDIPFSIGLSELNGFNGFRLSGPQADDRSGCAVAPGGDINGDGIDDLIIGAKYADTNQGGASGETYVVFGRKTTLAAPFALSQNLGELDATNGFRIEGANSGDFSGFSVAGADINGDKINDVIIGATYANGGAGATFVVFGHKATDANPFPTAIDLGDLDGTDGFRINGIDSGDYSGTAVAAGDINGDKIADIIIGAPFADAGAGETYVVFGRKASAASPFPATLALNALDGANGFRIDGVDGGDHFGASVAAADFNADKIPDLIIGAPDADPGADDSAGETYVIFGRKATNASPFAAAFNPATLDGTNGLRFDGIDDDDQSGAAVASAGDFNGDKINDIIIGAPGGDAQPDSNYGESYVVFGRKATSASTFPAAFSLSALNGANGLRIDGVGEDERSGQSVASAGDFNADKIGDVLIGAPFTNANAGAAYVVFGRKATAADPLPAFLQLNQILGDGAMRIEGLGINNQAGFAVGSAGDFNADKISDLIIGAPFVNSGAGDASVILGPTPEVGLTVNDINIGALIVPEIVDGGTFDFGELPLGYSIVPTFGVSNLGLSTLDVTRIKLPRGFSFIQMPEFPLEPLQDTEFRTLVTPTRIGTYSGKVSFSTNDPDEKKFDFTLQWTVIEQTEIASARKARGPIINVDSLPDLNNDWITNLTDVALMLRAINDNDSTGDLNDDDQTNTEDLIILLSNFAATN